MAVAYFEGLLTKGVVHMVKELDRKKGYLYLSWGAGLKIIEGEVVTMVDKTLNYSKQQWTCFCVNNTRGKRKYLCAEKPGVVYNKTVWLTEKDDELARNILIEYEQSCIDELKEKIENHEFKIKLLQETEL